ncbi:30S ribosomal protein S16 [Dermatophilaceae bacterium Sec6.4]|nr:30S ribosomal protein S16 [Actinomycetota bacterium]
MAVKIRLKRLGKIRTPQYRVVVMDSRTKRDGRAIEEIGKYHPKEDPSLIEIDSDRAQYWLGVGAQPTEQVHALLRVTGDWQKFKGEPGAEGTLRVKEAPRDKKAAYEAALAAAQNESDAAGKGGATTRKKAAASTEKVSEKSTEKATEKPAEKAEDSKPVDELATDAAAPAAKEADAATAEAAASTES